MTSAVSQPPQRAKWIPSSADRCGWSAAMQISLLLISLWTIQPASGVDRFPHCGQVLSFCELNQTTSACVFTKSIDLTCGSAALPTPIPSATSNATNGSSTTTSSNASIPSAQPSTDDPDMCEWAFAGDVIFAPNILVQIHGSDCLVHISTKRMVHFSKNATLMASGISVDATSVRMEPFAVLNATFDGIYKQQPGFFAGKSEFGGSNGGSGGRRVVAGNGVANSVNSGDSLNNVFNGVANSVNSGDSLNNGSINNQYFDVRAHALELHPQKPLVDQVEATTDHWNLARFWTNWELTRQSHDDDQRDFNARLLMGSGSFAADSALVLSGLPMLHGAQSPNSSVESQRVGAGGRIRVYTSKDLVVMQDASILANGVDAKDGVAGGSGGSIWLKTSQFLLNGKVSAKGGDAFCRFVSKLSAGTGGIGVVGVAGAIGTTIADGGSTASGAKAVSVQDCFPAGGGGRVMIGFTSSSMVDSLVDVTGGQLLGKPSGTSSWLLPVEEKGLAGASGTFFRMVLDATDHQVEGTLVVSGANKFQPRLVSVPGAVTTLHLAHEEPGPKMTKPWINTLVVTDGATCAANRLIVDRGNGLGDIRVLNHSSLVTLTTNTMNVQTNDLFVTDSSQVAAPWGSLLIQGTSVTLDFSVTMVFAEFARIETKSTLHLDAVTTLAPPSMTQPAKPGGSSSGLLSLHSDGDVIIGGNTSIGLVHVVSENAILMSGSLKATKRPSVNATFMSCDVQPAIPFDPSASSLGNFTLVMNAKDSIIIGTRVDTQVSASAALICAQSVIHLQQGAVVSANGSGLFANQSTGGGIGGGTCLESLGGGGGYGGRGADSSPVNQVGDYAPGGMAYGTTAGKGMLGSGGGCDQGGTGGGLINLGASTIFLDGEVQCNGEPGMDGAGGGSGGFLRLSVLRALRGSGRITATGGDSYCPPLKNESQKVLCGGGGGGGRLQLHGCDHTDFTECTSAFVGNYTVAGGESIMHVETGIIRPLMSGQDPTALDPDDKTAVTPNSQLPLPAQNGTFVGFPCAPGYGGLFCRICVVGTYKSESNNDECVECTNAPTNSHYVTQGSISANCEWACDPGYSGDNCVSPLQQLLDACGGKVGFILVLLSITVFFILVGFACRNRKEPPFAQGMYRDSTTSERQHLLARAGIVENNNSTRNKVFGWLFRWFYWRRVAYPKLMERDLPEHMARIYFSGTNDVSSPLKMRLTVPNELKSVLHDDEFKRFAEQINAALAWPSSWWRSWGDLAYIVVAILCYPFARMVTQYRRHLRMNSVKRIVSRYNHAFMKGPRARGLLNAVKLGYSGDYSLVYLELLNRESSHSDCVPTTKIGKPALPLVLLFAGCGTYNSPFYLDPSDLLVRSVPQCPELTAFIDDQWVEFVAELNELLRIVQRQNEVLLVRSLIPVAEFLEQYFASSGGGGVGSMSMLSSSMTTTAGSAKLGGLRIYLGRFYVEDDVDCSEEFKLGILLTINKTDRSSSLGMLGSTPKKTGPGAPSRYGSTLTGSKELDQYDMYGRKLRANDSFGSTDDALLYETSLLTSAKPTTQRQRRGSVGKGLMHSRIREEALRVRSSTGGSTDASMTSSQDDSLLSRVVSTTTLSRNKSASQQRKKKNVYEGWLGPVDASLPVPGVLICASELQDRLEDFSREQLIRAFIRSLVSSRNVVRSRWLSSSWMVILSLLGLLLLDLAITFAMIANLKCARNGEFDANCTVEILLPVLLFAPLAIVFAPIAGIVSLALSSSSFCRKYSVWNLLSMVNVCIAILACYAKSSQLVAPWFTSPFPVLPVVALVVKMGEARFVELYVASLETKRTRRGWRGLLKRRLSDASGPPESPDASSPRGFFEDRSETESSGRFLPNSQ